MMINYLAGLRTLFVKMRRNYIDGIGEIPENYLRDGELLQLGAEDFGFYAQKAPSCFIKMAVGEYASAHNEHFMVDEHWIQLMTRVMCMAAVAFQNESREIHE